jgi:hypothetical protein
LAAAKTLPAAIAAHTTGAMSVAELLLE